MGGYVKRVIEMLPKLSEEEVRRLFKSVASENSLLDSIIESLPTGLVIVDKKWKILQKNKAANRFLFSGGVDESKSENEPIWNLISEEEIADFISRTAAEDKSNVSEEFTT